MALIKCPECGHEVSDKAPVCPHCGIEIAGKADMHTTHQPAPVPPMPSTPPLPPVGGEPQRPPQPKKSNHTVLIFSFLFALIVCGAVFYFYTNANSDKEQEAYEYAMQSQDTSVLQSYLENYPDADEAHRDSVQSHLDLLKMADQEWTNAVVSGSKEALLAYMRRHPDSPHKQEAADKIDSLDWNKAKNLDTASAYQTYLDEHTDGIHIEEAEAAMKKVKSRDLQPEEKQIISGLFRQFFQSINSRNEGGLVATCEDILSSLLGKQAATQQDVVTFMHKLYKEGISNLNWHINDDYQIKKREVGDDSFEYSVKFTAVEQVTNSDGTEKQNYFRISAVVSPEGKISEFNLTKLNAEE